MSRRSILFYRNADKAGDAIRCVAVLLVCWFAGLSGAAQTITLSAPSQVSAGENFRVAYTVNTQDVEDFRSGIRSNEVAEVIAGPYTSSQSSFQMTNGHTTSSSSITYTYTLYALKSGTFNIPAAQAVVGGKTISSRPAKIVVSGTARQSNSAPDMHQDQEPQMRAAGSKISGNDLFIKVSANKRRVHEQEPVLLTYKVYTLVDLTQLNGKMPDLTGFHTQEIPLPQQKSFHVEQVNGRSYRCVTWSQYVMYPQMTGKLEIPSITFKGIVVQQNRNVDPFEAFFNGGSGYVEVKRDIVAPGLTIQVDPLPTRPENFSGGVGRLNISAQIDKTEVNAGDPVSLRVVVGGNGNLKLIKQPVVAFPKDFDTYDAKVTDKTRLTANGVEGNMVYDFLAVPRNQGNYTIPPIEFVYYDTSANAYRTMKTQAFELQVGKGSGRATTVTDYGVSEAKDIRPIKSGEKLGSKPSERFFGTTAYWLSLLLPFIAFIALLIIFRKRAIDNADLGKLRGKKANKVATKRLRKARGLMEKGQSAAFYEETLRALWGYVGDKLNMPVEQLSRDNISDNLRSRNVGEDVIERFLTALDECEFERYAPGDATGNMNKTFSAAMTAIEQIEAEMKKKGGNAAAQRSSSSSAAAQRSNSSKVTSLADSCTTQGVTALHRSVTSGSSSSNGLSVKMILALLFLTAATAAFGAVTKQSADEAYKTGNYQKAIEDYQQLLKEGPAATLYYNLGNAYFRTDNITQAIIAYERALVLDPGDNDTRYNLEFARSKTIDKVTPESEMFFFSWYRSLVKLCSVDGWARLAVISVILVLLLVLLYLFGPRLILRQIGFYGAVLFLLLFAVSNLFAWQQKRYHDQHRAAVVTAPSVSVHKTPGANGSEAFVLHEGTHVNINDTTIRQWYGIRLDDGREGWLPVNSVEEI